MKSQIIVKRAMQSLLAGLLVAFMANSVSAAEKHTSKQFQGPKANTGTVTHWKEGDVDMLTFSDDFKTPETPDPHVRIIDTHGNAYLLNKCMIKAGDNGEQKFNKTIALPAYIHDIAKVQIWCAWAETVLGETDFDMSVKLTSK